MKTLPLDLTILRLFTLLYICLIFSYIIIALFFPRKSNNIFIEEIIKIVFIPIIEFDTYLRANKYAKPIYTKISNYFWPKLDFLIIKTNLLYTIFWIFPRFILLFALYIDVFLFHKFHYKYMVILFGLLLFLNRYFKYSLKKTKEYLIEKHAPNIKLIITDYVPFVHPSELEPDYDPDDPENAEWPATMALPFEIFINFYVKSKVYDNIIIENKSHQYSENLYDEYWIKYSGDKMPQISITGTHGGAFINGVPFNYTNILGTKVPANYNVADDIISKQMNAYAKKAIDNTLKSALLHEYYSKTSTDNQRIKSIKILIYANYLICWLYVLVISLPSLNIGELLEVLALTWLRIPDPFLETIIWLF